MGPLWSPALQALGQAAGPSRLLGSARRTTPHVLQLAVAAQGQRLVLLGRAGLHVRPMRLYTPALGSLAARVSRGLLAPEALYQANERSLKPAALCMLRSMSSPEAGPVPVWAHETVEIVPPNPRWPELAAAEISRLERLLGPRLVAGIHHVGSTSVPGLEAKPILDLIAGIRDHAPDPDPALTTAGWHLVPVELDGQPWRRLYVLPKDGKRYSHLHLVVPSSAQFHIYLTFPKQLRADLETTRAYAALKRELAERHRTDREAYTRAKASFIQGVLARSSPLT
jgi:GrpB-like predicted nucleotidyltransferase (UPF0157 family)